MTVLGMSVVIKTTNREAAVSRYRALLAAEVGMEFEIPGSELTVSTFPGLSVLSGSEAALARANVPLASVAVDSLSETQRALTSTGWTMEGSMGSPGSVLARDPDGSLLEFVELPKDAP